MGPYGALWDPMGPYGTLHIYKCKNPPKSGPLHIYKCKNPPKMDPCTYISARIHEGNPPRGPIREIINPGGNPKHI